ncbi:MAG: amidohydrolase [Clostridiales bacterium]|nr:amidohydrolase [Clostridiales bacterium]
MNIEDIEIVKCIEKHRDLILDAERRIWKNPETGYKEWETSSYLEKEFEKLGYTLVRAEDIPGFYTKIETGREGPCVLILGELDSLLCHDHPEADPKTGAVHACGHNAQCAALLGIAAALKEDGALDGLSGSIKLCAVPAEELIETEYRETLRKKGIIRYYGGKTEFLSRGYFDDVDLAIMVHTTVGERGFVIKEGGNGCIVKNIEFRGKASHAGGSPHRGINALYATNVAMTAINALRETFKDQDHVRVHPIITSGGTAVNAIPSSVTLQSYVRGKSIEAIKGENEKINRALAAAAASLGANVKISDRPGYTPLINDENLKKVAAEAMHMLLPSDLVEITDGWGTGSTDMGDISAVIPAIHPYSCGASGTGHGNDYYIEHPESACLDSARLQLMILKLLLENDAARGREIVEKRQMRYETIEDFLEDLDRAILDKEAVLYNDDGTVTLDFN